MAWHSGKPDRRIVSFGRTEAEVQQTRDEGGSDLAGPSTGLPASFDGRWWSAPKSDAPDGPNTLLSRGVHVGSIRRSGPTTLPPRLRGLGDQDTAQAHDIDRRAPTG